MLGRDPNWEEMFNSIDRNEDGQIDFAEYIEAASNRMKMLNETNLRIAFDMLDLNGDGVIDATEIQQSFSNGRLIQTELLEQKIDEQFWQSMIAEIDEDLDGKIDY